MNMGFALFKYFPYGGLQRDCLSLARECCRRGHQVTLYCIRAEGVLPEDVPVVLVPVSGMRNHVRYLRFARAMRKLRDTGVLDWLLGFNKMPGLDVYYAADSCYREKAMQKPFWYRMGARSRNFLAFEESVFGTGSQTEILLLDPAAKREYQNHYGTVENRVHLLSPGIAPDRRFPDNPEELRASLRAEMALGEGDYLVLMVGSGFRIKGLDRALLAMASLPDELRKRVRFVIIGKDKATPYLRMAAKLGIGGQVRLIAGRDDIPRLMQGADLLIHPAYRENTGMVLLEAVVAGLPVLTTDTCGYARYVSEAGAGQVVTSPFQQKALNQALARMLVSPQREQWRHNGIRFGQETDLFRPYEKIADWIEQHLEEKERQNAVLA